MAKLIGHIFNPQKGGYGAIEIDGLKETAKQFARTADTTEAPPRTLCECWRIMPKNQLGELRRGWSGTFTMYALQEDMPHFRELVISSLRKSANHQRKEFEAAIAALEAAKYGGKE